MTKVILPALLVSSILALLSFSPVSMPMMGMDKLHTQMDHHTNEDISVMLCCEIIGASCASLVWHFSEYVTSFFVKGENQIATTGVLTQPIFLEILSPPPKA